MRNMKRLLAGVLTAVMLATFLPAGILAAEGDPPDGGSVNGGDQAQINLDDLELYVTVGGEKVCLIPESEDGGIAAASLIPLKNYSYTLDLQSYFPDELKEVDISALLTALRGKYNASNSIPADKTIAAWAKWSYFDENGNQVDSSHNDDYTLVGEDTTIDLSYGARTGSGFFMELIVGDADQLNPNNIRVQIRAIVGGYYDLLAAEAYNTGNTRSKITVYSQNINTYRDKNILYIAVNPKTWSNEPNACLGLRLGSRYSALTARVYQGYYETKEDITKANAAEITSQIMNQPNLAQEGGYSSDYGWKRDLTGMTEVTLVLERSGNTACVMPVILYMFPDNLYAYVSDLCYKSGSSYYSAGWSQDLDKAGFDNYQHYTLYSGRKANETYYAEIYAYDPETQRGGTDAVKGVYLGHLTLEQTKNETGLTCVSNSYSNSIYCAVNFAEHPDGAALTVVDINDEIWHFGIEIEEQDASESTVPRAPTPLSQDTYFQIQGANKTESGIYSPYVMSYSDDSYYYYGYQTVFLLDSGNPVDAEKIVPRFWTGSKVVMQASERDEDGNLLSGKTQTSGQTAINFTPGETVQYSALAENGGNLKNYFVTFLTQQERPTLFVNGTNDESNWQEDPQNSGEKIPARTVDLTKSWNYRHDIFFANVGKEKLTNLSVTLTGADGTGEAQNVQLDGYWTIGATKELAGFTSTVKGQIANGGGTDSNGELANVGKIRLVPMRDENGIKAGKISGLLTISAGTGADTQTVKILLTGTAGSFQINTDTIRDAVQYVSYSSVIQTNYITSGETDAVQFTAAGLPAGLNMRANGELYGAPLSAGDFTFTVTATAAIDGEMKSDTKTFTIHVEGNQDNNVWYYDRDLFSGDTTYLPVIAIPNENDVSNILGNATEGTNSWDNPTQELKSEGEYGLFVDVVRLDGRVLQSGADYNSAPGSTRITIQTQTLRNAGNGTHTISVEFRESGTNELRRTAQNYTLTSLGTSTRPSGSSSSGGSSSSSSTSYSVNTADVPGGYGSVSADSAKPGTKITVSITPNNGYIPAGLTVTRSNGKTIAATRVSDTEYTFIMPSGAVTVTPKFNAIPAAVGSFYDVPAESWFCDAVKYVFDRELMVGTSSNTFNPGGTVSRSMLVTVLYSLEGKPPVSGGSPFTDVQPDQWFTAPVIWAAENKLAAGLGNGTFGVDAPLTREQAAVILYGYARLKGYDVTPSNDLSQFTDTDSISAFALPALQWANAAGLISGYSQDTLAPDGTTTRAQLAVILRSFCENVAK